MREEIKKHSWHRFLYWFGSTMWCPSLVPLVTRVSLEHWMILRYTNSLVVNSESSLIGKIPLHFSVTTSTLIGFNLSLFFFTSKLCWIECFYKMKEWIGFLLKWSCTIFFFKDDLLLYCLAASRPLLEQIWINRFLNLNAIGLIWESILDFQRFALKITQGFFSFNQGILIECPDLSCRKHVFSFLVVCLLVSNFRQINLPWFW